MPGAVPSFDPASPKFEGLCYWPGPIWRIINTMVGVGLAEAGLIAEAARVRVNTAQLICGHGFVEYFDPNDDTPAGAETFAWAAAIFWWSIAVRLES